MWDDSISNDVLTPDAHFGLNLMNGDAGDSWTHTIALGVLMILASDKQT